MGVHKNKSYPLRIDNKLLEKMKIIAEENSRTLNKQFEKLVRDYIRDYEEEYGEIEINE